MGQARTLSGPAPAAAMSSNQPLTRRQWLVGAAAGAASVAALPLLTACAPALPKIEDLPGGFTGKALERGHALRPQWQRLAQGLDLPTPAAIYRVPVLIAGGGMAGLAAARALELAGVQGAALLDPEAVLFIDDGKPQVMKYYALLENRMGADQNMNIASGQGLQLCRLFPALVTARQNLKDNACILGQGPQAFQVLPRQNLRRRHHHALPARLYRHQFRVI